MQPEKQFLTSRKYTHSVILMLTKAEYLLEGVEVEPFAKVNENPGRAYLLRCRAPRHYST